MVQVWRFHLDYFFKVVAFMFHYIFLVLSACLFGSIDVVYFIGKLMFNDNYF
jgi:hypothetical protein